MTNGPRQYNQTFSAASRIAVSPANNETIYVETDDGNVWVSLNDRNSWEKISKEFQLPVRWVTRVAADPFDGATAYVIFSGYRYDDYMAHVFCTTNFGRTWTDISGDLPEAPINDIIVDQTLDSALYIATDVGAFVSWNLGQNFGLMGEDLPNVPCLRPLAFHDEYRMPIAATYGRSMYKIYLDEFVSRSEIIDFSKGLKIFLNHVKDVCNLYFS